MKKSLNKIIGLSVLVIGLVAGLTLSQTNQNINKNAAPASSLSLEPTSQELHLGNNFTTQVVIDTGTNKVTGIDLQMTYDSSKLHINEIKPTSQIESFNTVIKNEIDNTNGILRYAAFTFDKTLGITGNLNILTISGSVPSNSAIGSYEINFDPETIIIATGEGQNVLISNQSTTINVIEDEPNSCGGTCGSNFNCKANYFCFEGHCRNPVCASDSDCNCTITSSATTKPATPKPVAQKPVITLITAKPVATNASKGGNETLAPPTLDYESNYPDIVREEDTYKTTDDLKNQVIGDFVKYLVGILVLITIGIIVFIIWKRRKNNIPHILPPTNI